MQKLKEIVAVLFVSILPLAVHIVSANVNDSSASFFASWAWKNPDPFAHNEDLTRQIRLDGSAVNSWIEIVKSIPFGSEISYGSLNLKRPETATVTLISSIQGYEVYVDSIFVKTEGSYEPLDGVITIRVDGNLKHSIRIIKGNYFQEDIRYYERENSYTINFK